MYLRDHHLISYYQPHLRVIHTVVTNEILVTGRWQYSLSHTDTAKYAGHRQSVGSAKTCDHQFACLGSTLATSRLWALTHQWTIAYISFPTGFPNNNFSCFLSYIISFEIYAIFYAVIMACKICHKCSDQTCLLLASNFSWVSLLYLYIKLLLTILTFSLKELLSKNITNLFRNLYWQCRSKTVQNGKRLKLHNTDELWSTNPVQMCFSYSFLNWIAH